MLKPITSKKLDWIPCSMKSSPSTLVTLALSAIVIVSGVLAYLHLKQGVNLQGLNVIGVIGIKGSVIAMSSGSFAAAIILIRSTSLKKDDTIKEREIVVNDTPEIQPPVIVDEQWQDLIATKGKEPRSLCYNFEGEGLIASRSKAVMPGELALPRIGHYGNSYDFNIPVLYVRFPRQQIKHFPKAIQDQFKGLKDVDLFFCLGFDNLYKERSRNICYHAVIFPDAESGANINLEVPMGVFEPEGIVPNPHSSIAFHQLKKSSVYIHPHSKGQTCISPNNARFQIKEGAAAYAFFSAAIHPKTQRGCAFFYVSLFTPELYTEMRDLSKKPTMKQFLDGLKQTQLPSPIQKRIQSLFD